MKQTVASIPFRISSEIVMCLLNSENRSIMPQMMASSARNIKIDAAENQTNRLCLPLSQYAYACKTKKQNVLIVAVIRT